MRSPLALGLLLAASAASADIYRWTDASGRVHFGDSAASAGQAGARAAPATAPASPPPPASDAAQQRERQRRALDVLQRSTAESEQAAARREAERKAQQDRQAAECKQVREMLADFSGGLVYTDAPDGTRRFLTTPEIQEQAEHARRHLQQHCE